MEDLKLIYVYDRKSLGEHSAMVLARDFTHALEVLAASKDEDEVALSYRAKNYMDDSVKAFVLEPQVLCSHYNADHDS